VFDKSKKGVILSLRIWSITFTACLQRIFYVRVFDEGNGGFLIRKAKGANHVQLAHLADHRLIAEE
jgi:hypothetical protein